ncbi:ATP-binding protein [Streptomyces sp. NPDC001941]|uniref:ATP-binding protein n=1 Tax=Streptomyces sp. NPDC001941 TaxID=3154659 RepID=UPI0033166EFD
MTSTHHQLPALVRLFGKRFTATGRGARLARQLAVVRLTAWAVSPELVERAEHVVAELASNAVRHGRVPGRDFRLTLALSDGDARLRVEVTDARGERWPRADGASDEGGRGLMLVEHLADRWGCTPFPPGCKTVWAELGDCTPPCPLTASGTAVPVFPPGRTVVPSPHGLPSPGVPGSGVP